MDCRKIDRPSKCGMKRDDKCASYQEIFECYKNDHKKINDDEIEYFKNMESFDKALEKAAKAIYSDGKMFDHQRRVGSKRLEEFYLALLERRGEIKFAKTFDELLGIISTVADDIYRVGKLAAYDTSVRIGAFSNSSKMLPNQIYLHAGVRKAANYLGLGRGRVAIDINELPQEFSSLEAYQLENLMCIYREDLRALARPKSRRDE